MTKPKLTKWECGQELVKVADALSDAAGELKDFENEREIILKLRRELERFFDENNYVEEMGFGI